MKLLPLSLVALTGVLVGCSGGSADPKPPVNQAPKLSAIADQSIVANQTEQSVGLTLNDETPGSVTVGIASNNAQLLADATQTVSGTGEGRLVLLTPTPDETGEAIVTVTATDAAGLTDTVDFVLTVAPEQMSMQQFARAELDRSPEDDPELINAVEFMQDAEDDDFADLFED